MSIELVVFDIAGTTVADKGNINNVFRKVFLNAGIENVEAADVDEVMEKAIKAGATEISPAKDYDYGYRQGNIQDIFGHQWMIQSKIQDMQI